MINTNIITASGVFSGFKNYTTTTFSATYAGGNILAGAYVGPIRASVALNNSNAISEVQIQYSGIDTFWRKIPGNIITDYPTAGTRTYEVQSLTYFSGGILYVDSYLINESATTISLPAVSFVCRGYLYVAPF